MRTSLLLAALCAATTPLQAHACVEPRALIGTLEVPMCLQGEDCIPAGQAVFEYSQTLEIPNVFTVAMQTSPWRMYDASDRILTIEELAGLIRAQRTTETGAYLVGSWTGKLPDGDGKTLAERLSAELDGFPVDGSDGFLWLTAKGGMRTTHQAFSVWKAGAYSVSRGEDVMTAMIPGAMVQFEDRFAKDNAANGVLRAGVGYDAFMLCPERAIAAFERAAEMGSAIGAYNAALMHEQNGDSEKAIRSLERAVSLGDDKAKAHLGALRERTSSSISE